jgi:hypothetical protein
MISNKQNYRNNKQMYLDLQGGGCSDGDRDGNDSAQHMHSFFGQIGGFASLPESIIDVLLEKFNVLEHSDLFNNDNNITKFNKKSHYNSDIINKLLEICDAYMDKKTVGDLRNKRNNLLKNDVETVRISFNVMIGKIEKIKGYPVFVDVKESNKKNLSEKYALLNTIANIKEVDLFWNVANMIISKYYHDNHKNKLDELIFGYYSPGIIDYTAPNILILDEKNYVVYQKGSLTEINDKNIYSFDRKTFVSTSIETKKSEDKELYTHETKKSKDKELYTQYATNKYYHNITDKITGTEFCLSDLKNFYEDNKEILKKIMIYGKYFVTNVPIPYEIIINENINNFISTIYGIRDNNNNNISGKFTKKNDLIYTFILSNTCNTFIQTFKNILSEKEKEKYTQMVDITSLQNDIDIRKILQNDIQNDIDIRKILQNDSRLSLKVNRYLYCCFKTCLSEIIKSYNYVRLTKNDNKYKDTYLQSSIIITIYDFFEQLNKFMNDAVKFKESLISIFKIEDVNSTNLIISSVLSYIIHIILNDKNINFSKTQILDNLIGYDREIKDNLIGYGREIKDNQEEIKATPEQKDFDIWINDILIAEYDIFINLNNKSYKFNSCGESLVLNIMNYALMKDDNGVIDVNGDIVFDLSILKLQPRNKFIESLIGFYEIYGTLNLQRESIEKVVEDWTQIISKIPDILYVYPTVCEFIPTLENVTKLFTILLNAKDGTTLINMINNIKTRNIIMQMDIGQMDNKNNIIFDNKYDAFFSNYHGHMKAIVNSRSEPNINTNFNAFKKACNKIVEMPSNLAIILFINNKLDLCTPEITKNLDYIEFANERVLSYFDSSKIASIFALNGYDYKGHYDYISIYSTLFKGNFDNLSAFTNLKLKISAFEIYMNNLIVGPPVTISLMKDILWVFNSIKIYTNIDYIINLFFVLFNKNFLTLLNEFSNILTKNDEKKFYEDQYVIVFQKVSGDQEVLSDDVLKSCFLLIFEKCKIDKVYCADTRMQYLIKHWNLWDKKIISTNCGNHTVDK